jgi:hypothetical protein
MVPPGGRFVDEPERDPLSPFETCSMCGTRWQSRGDFLADKEIRPIGYMANFEDLKLGLFHFNHEACGTTLALVASHFTDLYSGPMFEGRRTGSSDCPGYCLRREELRPCPASCECAFVREVVDRVARWEKSG